MNLLAGTLRYLTFHWVVGLNVCLIVISKFGFPGVILLPRGETLFPRGDILLSQATCCLPNAKFGLQEAEFRPGEATF